MFLDGPGGTQVPRAVIEAMTSPMTRGFSNLGGFFAASADSEAIVAAARDAVADFLNARRPNEIIFGQNMTSLTFAASRALGSTWRGGDEIIVTRLDHDANVHPWVVAAQAAGATVRFADFGPAPDCLMAADAITDLITARTRFIAVTRASNSLGTMVDVGAVARAAHAVDALVYVDAVHFAPHGPIDVQALDCDFLACSAYKFFGPHTGILYGKQHVLDGLDPLRVRHGHHRGPEAWETGTQSFESLAGVTAAVGYLASLGEGADRRARLTSAMERVAGYERTLSGRFLAGLAEMPSVQRYGPATPTGRTPTFGVLVEDMTPADAAKELAAENVFVWSGHNYAIEVMRRLGRLEQGGLLRIGFVHYNTAEEVDLILDALDRLATGRSLKGLRST